MNDTEILDWIERHLMDIVCPLAGGVKITWTKNGEQHETTGNDLRDAIRKAAGWTAVSQEKENFFDTVRNDPTMKEEDKDYWLKFESKRSEP